MQATAGQAMYIACILAHRICLESAAESQRHMIACTSRCADTKLAPAAWELQTWPDGAELLQALPKLEASVASGERQYWGGQVRARTLVHVSPPVYPYDKHHVCFEADLRLYMPSVSPYGIPV